MTEMILKQKILQAEELQQIAALAEYCKQSDGLELKLNWETLKHRTGKEYSDFLFFRGTELLGYLGLYQFNPSELEVSGMVHPDFRHQGIFTKLYQEAKLEGERRRVKRFLFINERNSNLGQRWITKFGGTYAFSEYLMELDPAKWSAPEESRVTLRQATWEEIPELARQNQLYFPEADLTAEIEFYQTNFSNETMLYLAEVEGRIVGKVEGKLEAGKGLIYGLGVLPEVRRQGYGREILSLMVEKLLQRQAPIIALEVNAANQNALRLYQDCGFDAKIVYDYYQFVL